MRKVMENSTKFNLIIEKLNQRIANLNIKLSKDSNNIELQNKLDELLKDKERVYKGTIKDLDELTLKYGETNNE